MGTYLNAVKLYHKTTKAFFFNQDLWHLQHKTSLKTIQHCLWNHKPFFQHKHLKTSECEDTHIGHLKPQSMVFSTMTRVKSIATSTPNRQQEGWNFGKWDEIFYEEMFFTFILHLGSRIISILNLQRMDPLQASGCKPTRECHILILRRLRMGRKRCNKHCKFCLGWKIWGISRNFRVLAWSTRI